MAEQQQGNIQQNPRVTRAAVYAIRNKINNKLYVGSSLDYKKRFRTHKSLLKRKVHHAYKLQRAWNKYGIENFIFEPIEHVYFSNDMSKSYKIEVLRCIEQYYTNKFDAASNNNYSTSADVGNFEIKDRSRLSIVGWDKRRLKGEVRLSDEHKNNISIALRNSKNLKKALAINGLERRKKVYQYALSGELLHEWNSIYDITESISSFKYNGIRKVINGEAVTYKGYTFSHIKEDVKLPRAIKKYSYANGK